MCFPDGELVIGDIDGQFLLDVATGPPEGFSLAAGDNLHFVTRSATTEWSTP
jgi:uncharacterized protein (DUF779 family)